MLRSRKANRSLVLSGSVLFACVLLAGCGSERRDPLGEVHDLTGVPLSEDLRPAVEAALVDLAAPEPVNANTDLLARYDALIPLIDRPESRAEAAALLTEYWRENPESYVWLQLARNKRHLLGGEFDYDELLAHPAYADTELGPGPFVDILFNIPRSERNKAYLGLDIGYEDSVGLNRFWLVRKQAAALSQQGEGPAAIRLLLEHLPDAQEIGGARLAARMWQTIAAFLRLSDRLDGAVHAQCVRIALCRKSSAEYHELQARLSLADILHDRRELTGAYAVLDTCISAARLLNHPWILTRCLNKAAGYHAESGHLDRALGFDLQSLDIAYAMQDSFNVPITITNVAYDLRLLGRLAEARAYLDEGRLWVAAYPHPRLVGGYPLREIPFYLHVGDYATADSLLKVVVGKLPAAALAVEEAEFHLEQIDFARDLGRADLAYGSIARLEELRFALYDRMADSNRAAEFAMATADLLGQQGEFTRAAAALEDAADAVARGGGEGMDWKPARARGELALLRDDAEAAGAEFSQSLQIAEAGSEPDKIAESRFLLGTALIEAGRPEEAVAILAPLEELSVFGPRFRIRISTLLYASIARARGGHYRAAADGFEQVLAQTNPHTPPDLLARLHLELGAVREQMGNADLANIHLTEAARVLSEADARTFSSVLRLPNRRLRRDLVEALVGFAYDHPDRHRNGEIAEVTLGFTALAGTGNPGDAPGRWPGVWFFVGRDRSFRWLRYDRGLEIAELPGESELMRLVAPVVADVGQPSRQVDQTALVQLSDLLVSGLAGRWPSNRTLYIKPDAILHAVPWSSLILDGAPLILQGPLCELSGTDAVAARRGDFGPGNRILVLGDNRSLDDARGSAAEALRFAEEEAVTIADMWPGDAVTLKLGAESDGLEASDLEGQDVIHIASHARFSEGLANRATMRLAATRAPLTATGVGRQAFEARLIYLSCCEADRPLAGGGLGSFARACLSAGAGAVIASGQRIDDEAAGELARRFYRHWLDGWTIAAALRAAQLEIRAERPEWAHPFYWATYRLIGDPR